MKRTLPICALFAALTACSAAGAPGGKVDLANDEAKTFYALGFNVATGISQHSGTPLTSDQINDIIAGFSDELSSRQSQVDMQTYGPKIGEMMRARSGGPQMAPQAAADPAKLAEEKKKGEDFAEKASKEPGAEKLPSGLVFKSITPGTGKNPTVTDTVKVNYEGKLPDGTVFDASAKHGGPAQFPLNRVIPCWTEGVQKLKVGGKAELVCPSTIAYGDMGHPPVIPGGATLVFTVELLDIVQQPAMAPPPGAPHINVQPGAPGSQTLQIHPAAPGTPPPPKP